ncbi:MAG: hypothetical protein IJ035_00405 [Oscillospiraceae bacterium]|nr:hypothetical protein [Oscillospiraceae bacterium]
MKKILAAVISLAMCAAMLTACGSDSDTAEVVDSVTTTAAAEETTAETEAETTAETTTEAETEKETEAETTAEAETEAETAAETEAETKAEAAETASYASLNEFANSGDAFNLATNSISAGDSLTYEWIRIFEGADSLYMDVEATDGSMSMVMGMKEDKIYMKMYEKASDTNLIIIFKDSVMYMLDEATKSGYYMTADESLMEEYDVGAMLGEIDFDAETDNAADVLVTKVEIDGAEYTFEVAETGGGFLFDKDENLVAILTNEADSELTALKVNEFSGSAADSIFEVPSDYQLIDMEAMLAE